MTDNRLLSEETQIPQSFGINVFTTANATPYLIKHGLCPKTLDNPKWVREADVDKVAAAVLDWAIDRGAKFYCHWFQPLGASLLRHGQTAQVQHHLSMFDKDNKLVWSFTGKQLLQGETDGSSFPNGGLRSTDKAAGYLLIDTSSPMFIREDVLYIPAVLVSYYGDSLDEKTPLLRANERLNEEGIRLFNLLGLNTKDQSDLDKLSAIEKDFLNIKKVEQLIGLEQEFFFILKKDYQRRPDLQYCGRTLIGHSAARGQDLSDHYMAPLSYSSPVLACMREIQEEAFKMGIPLRTRHREVAPNQYEFAPLYGNVTTQIDQNLVILQLLEEIPQKYGLVALINEKPFKGINGSGKHNNWSIGTNSGINLFNVNDLNKLVKIYKEKLGKEDINLFPLVISCVLRGLSKHNDLMRLAVASPGNDFRLGDCEAPPAIMSCYLGEDLTNYLKNYMEFIKNKQENFGKTFEELFYTPTVINFDLGISSLPFITIPSEDRNRTSPFPYGGHRFEFRAVGSSQNVSLVNTVLATVIADSFKAFNDKFEAELLANPIATKKQIAEQIVYNTLNESFYVVFNGNNYDKDNQKELVSRGIMDIESTVDAILAYTKKENIELFSKLNILTEKECYARQNVHLNHYTGIVLIEALCLSDLISKYVIPSVNSSKLHDSLQVSELHIILNFLRSKVQEIESTSDIITKARLARILRLETMDEIRNVVDKFEADIPADAWKLATYKEILFLDSHH